MQERRGGVHDPYPRVAFRQGAVMALVAGGNKCLRGGPDWQRATRGHFEGWGVIGQDASSGLATRSSENGQAQHQRGEQVSLQGQHRRASSFCSSLLTLTSFARDILAWLDFHPRLQVPGKVGGSSLHGRDQQWDASVGAAASKPPLQPRPQWKRHEQHQWGWRTYYLCEHVGLRV